MAFCLAEDRLIEVQGHRGARGAMPENTLPAFQEGIEAGADALELDLVVTSDDYLIINHDFFIHHDLVRSLSLAEIKQIDCGRVGNPRFPKQAIIPGTTIPTLQELFDFIKSLPHPHAKKIRLNLEIKRNASRPELTLPGAALAKQVIDLVQANDFQDRVAYSSFDPDVLFEVRKLLPTAIIGLINEKRSLKEMLQMGKALKIQILSPEHILLKNIDDVTSLRDAGFRVIPWTVNDTNRLEDLLDMGIDGIITDYPREFVQFLKTRSKSLSL